MEQNPGLVVHNMKRRYLLSLILLAASLAFSVVMWLLHLPFFFVVLFIPLIPFFMQERTVRRCPVCGWETTGSERFCPFDATPLTTTGSGKGQ
ncbi:MAG: hypothetical protein NT112_02845 [Methanoregula sp.]|nr:hypothetical protein [Methanoregula sp.]